MPKSRPLRNVSVDSNSLRVARSLGKNASNKKAIKRKTRAITREPDTCYRLNTREGFLLRRVNAPRPHGACARTPCTPQKKNRALNKLKRPTGGARRHAAAAAPPNGVGVMRERPFCHQNASVPRQWMLRRKEQTKRMSYLI